MTARHTKEREAPIQGIYAGWRATGRLTLLEHEGPDEEAIFHFNGQGRIAQSGALVLAGRYVAFDGPSHLCSSTVCPAGGILRRVDIETGRSVATEMSREKQFITEVIDIRDLVLTPAGAVAWTEPGLCEESQGSQSLECAGYSVVVDRAPSPGFTHREVLTTSTTIDAHSLAVAGGYLYWTEARQPREATIG